MQQELGTSVQVDAHALINDADITHFKEQGYVFPRQGLPADDAAWMRETIERVFRDNTDWAGITRMPHIPLREGQEEGVKGGEELFKIAIHPTLIAAASRLIGPNLIMWGGEIFAKPAGTGKRTPWHQDCYNPAVKAGPGRKLPQSAQIWIAVDDVDPENGSLSFVAGSGREGPIHHEQRKELRDLLNFEVDTSSINEHRIVHSTMPSGHFSVHDLFVVHGANANISGRRRAGLTFHYMAAEDVYDRSFGSAIGSGRDKPAPLAQRPIWLVLGENQVPQNDFVTGHQNLGDLDAMAETRRLEMNAVLGV